MKTVPHNDTGSLMVAVLVSVVGMLLSAVLATIVIGQMTTTRNTVQRQHAVDAALAGLEVAAGQLRAAGDAQGNGVLSALPCGPFAGSVGVGGAATYTVTISYASSAGTPVVCLDGEGTKSAPAVANLVAAGIDRLGDPTRTLSATYRFRTTNQNIAGGQIHVRHLASEPDLCLDGGSATPATGAALEVQPCDAGSPQQTFAYNTNLTLSLVSSTSGVWPQGMCLDGGAVPHAVHNAAVTFQPCASTTQARQQWSFNDTANFEGTSNGRDLDGYCFNVQMPGQPGSPIVLRKYDSVVDEYCFGNDTIAAGNEQNFDPDRQVGAGAAGPASEQLVNFYEFGRCLDVTSQDWEYTYMGGPSYMIVSPCKQSPDGSLVLWNQEWQLPQIAAGTSSATGVISTKPSYVDFRTCLVSPLAVVAGTYVALNECPAPGPVPAAMNWTVYGNTGVYATSYTIADSNGHCLAPTDPDTANPDVHWRGDKVSKVIVVDCSGSTLEKWNAPPYVLQPTPLENFSEK